MTVLVVAGLEAVQVQKRPILPPRTQAARIFAQHVVPRVAGNAGKGLVHVNDGAVRQGDDALPGMGEHAGGKALLFVRQTALGDVVVGDDHTALARHTQGRYVHAEPALLARRMAVVFQTETGQTPALHRFNAYAGPGEALGCVVVGLPGFVHGQNRALGSLPSA